MEELGETVGIIIRMCEPIFLTGKCVFLDSGFFVSKWITAFLDFGVYVDALIKKHKYRPKGLPGYVIEQYFSDKDVTYVDMFEAITEDGHEGKVLNTFYYKEP